MSRGTEEPLEADGFERLLRRSASSFDIPLDPETLRRLAIFLCELDRWRRRINLTGPLSHVELVGHALESLVALPFIPEDARLIDVGSGAGFPGLPIAIAHPGARVTLLEPRTRRAAFLRHVSRRLELANVRVSSERVEALREPAFDVATMRAVGAPGEVVGDGRFLAPDGLLMAWTTRSSTVGTETPSVFRLERTLEIPFTREKVVAVFRKVG